MADFSTFWEPSGSPVRPQEGVSTGDNSTLLESIGNFGRQAGSIFKGILEDKDANAQKEAELFNAQTLANFTTDQLALTEAVETGQMSSAQARSRMRANLTRAISDNPMLLSDLSDSHKAITKSSGLGQQAYEGTPEEQAEARAMSDIVTSGWVSPNASREEKLMAVQKKRNFDFNLEMLKGQQQQLATLNAQLTNQRGQLGLQKDQISLGTASVSHQTAILGLEQAQLKRQSQLAAASVAMDGLTPFSQGLRTIAEQMKTGKIDQVTGQRMMDEQLGVIENTIRQTGSFAGTDMINNYMTMYRSAAELEKNYATGKIDLETYNRANELNMSRATLSITDDPNMATYAATAKVFPTTNVITQGNVNSSVVKFLESTIKPNATPPNVLPAAPQEVKDAKVGIKTIKESLGNVVRGTAEEGTDVQVANWMNKAMEGVNVYGPYAQDPAQYKDFVSLLADPNTGKFLEKNGAMIDDAAFSSSADIIQHNYMNVVVPALAQKFEQAVVGTQAVGGSAFGIKPGKEVPSQIEVKFVGSGITFQAKPGATTPGLANRVAELNRTVKPLANEVIQATAHLQRTTDYKAVYQNLFESQFTTGKKDEAEE